MIKASDLDGIDPDLAMRIIATARSIAPCLNTLEDGIGDDDPKPRSEAIAILKGVATEGAARGSRLISSQQIATARVVYNAGTWWSDDDRGALRALCSAAGGTFGGLPIGSFPKTSRAISDMWPEEC